MNIDPIEINGTTSSGSWSQNTPRISSGICLRIVISFTTATTTFDFKLTDSKDVVIFDSALEELTGTGRMIVEKFIPMTGIITMAISSASADESFTGRMYIET